MNEHTGDTHADLERQLLDILYLACVNETNKVVRDDGQNYNAVFCAVAREILEGIIEEYVMKPRMTQKNEAK